MSHPPAAALLHARIVPCRVCVLGDLVLDVIVRLRQPLAPGADAASEITLSAGGQAANVAAWVAALGGRRGGSGSGPRTTPVRSPPGTCGGSGSSSWGR